MNRESNLKVTLPINLELIKDHSNIEIIVLNYNSKGDLDEYIHTIDNTQLKYFKESTEKYFNMSRAKNIGSRLSTSDYILNLDADNFLTEDYITRLLQMLDEDVDIISMTTQKPDTGLGGRLGCKISVFNHLRGYDESLQGWGADDVDFETRAINYGYTIGYVMIVNEDKVCIPQTNTEKSNNYSKDNKDIFETQKRNRELIKNVYRPINSNGFGCCTLHDINNNEVVISSVEDNQLKLNINIYNDFFNNNINNDLLIEFKKVFGDNPNISQILTSAHLFNMTPFYRFANYLSSANDSNLCNPIEWCKGNIAAFFILASNSVIIHTDIVAFALVGLLYGRDVILSDEKNRDIYNKYLKQYNCRFKQTTKIKK